MHENKFEYMKELYDCNAIDEPDNLRSWGLYGNPKYHIIINGIANKWSFFMYNKGEKTGCQIFPNKADSGPNVGPVEIELFENGELVEEKKYK